MKSIKKLLSIVMVLAMVLALGAQAFAAAPTPVAGPSEDVRTTITVNEKNGTGGTYVAYQLMTLTTSEDNTHFSYTVNSKYSTAMQAAAGVSSDEAVIDYLETHKNDADAIRKFADAVYEAIKDQTADETATGNVFEDLEQGYYLIVETVAAADGGNDGVKSQVMLDTAGRVDISVTTKEEKPSAEKKVQDVNDSAAAAEGTNPTGWQDSADYDVGDAVPFQLTGTLPADYSTYDSYKVVFHDTEGNGLTFNEGSVKVSCGSTTIEAGEFADHGIVLNTSPSDNHTFDLEITDVKTTFPDATGSSEIVVEYTSTLNDDAVIGKPGNPNEMYMEYTNDHYDNGTGTTPKGKVVVFTYDLSVNKVDSGNDPLEGAEFALYKKVAAHTEGDGAVQLTKDGKVATGADGEVLLDGWYVEVELEGNSTEDGKSTTFTTEKGIDDGDYVLVETVTPDGYNSIDPKEFKVTADHEVTSDDPQLTEVKGAGDGEAAVNFTFKLEKAEGDSSALGQANIVNQSGVELPETGGIGTTIFYVVGAILVVGAVILLVTKRRMTGAEK